MDLKELSKEELLNEKLAYDAWIDAAAEEEVVLCDYCKRPTTDEQIMCEVCFADVMRKASYNGEFSSSPPAGNNEAVDGMDCTDAEGTEEEEGYVTLADMYKDGK